MKLELDHLVLNVRDMDAMLRFYLDLVGLAPHRVDEYRAGTALFPCARIHDGALVDLLPEAMWNTGGPTSPGLPNMNHFCLAMNEAAWQATLERLQGAGVEVEAGPLTLAGARGDGTSVYVRDPDGNRVELRHYGS